MNEGVLGNRYRLLHVLGHGGMSSVWSAMDLSMGREVAVKIIDLSGPDSAEALIRFDREVRSTAALNHRNIVTVYDTGVEGQSAYLVLELIPGATLAHELKTRGPLSFDEVRSVATQVCKALAAAHARGIVHRDIKPTNVMYDRDGGVKVLDFGITELIGDLTAGLTLTSTGQFLGTPSFAAPEQARGQKVDERSDLYAVGCLLTAMLTGRSPFPEGSPVEVLHAHAYTDPPDVRIARPDAPELLAALTMELLAKDPSERPQSAVDVLRRLGDGSGLVDPSTVSVVSPPTSRRHRAWLQGSGAAALLALVVGMSVYQPALGRTPPTATATTTASTQVHVINPFATDGTVSPGWTIKDDTGAPGVECGNLDTGSEFALTTNVHSCGSMADSAFACWKDPKAVSQLLCLSDPWSRILNRRRATHVQVTPRPADPKPLGVQLTDGTRWLGWLPGTMDLESPPTGFRQSFRCTSRTGVCGAIAGVAGVAGLLSAEKGPLFDKSRPFWTIRRATALGPFDHETVETVRVSDVWYVAAHAPIAGTYAGVALPTVNPTALPTAPIVLINGRDFPPATDLPNGYEYGLLSLAMNDGTLAESICGYSAGRLATHFPLARAAYEVVPSASTPPISSFLTLTVTLWGEGTQGWNELVLGTGGCADGMAKAAWPGAGGGDHLIFVGSLVPGSRSAVALRLVGRTIVAASYMGSGSQAEVSSVAMRFCDALATRVTETGLAAAA